MRATHIFLPFNTNFIKILLTRLLILIFYPWTSKKTIRNMSFCYLCLIYSFRFWQKTPSTGVKMWFFPSNTMIKWLMLLCSLKPRKTPSIFKENGILVGGNQTGDIISADTPDTSPTNKPSLIYPTGNNANSTLRSWKSMNLNPSKCRNIIDSMRFWSGQEKCHQRRSWWNKNYDTPISSIIHYMLKQFIRFSRRKMTPVVFPSWSISSFLCSPCSLSSGCPASRLACFWLPCRQPDSQKTSLLIPFPLSLISIFIFLCFTFSSGENSFLISRDCEPYYSSLKYIRGYVP